MLTQSADFQTQFSVRPVHFLYKLAFPETQFLSYQQSLIENAN